MADDPIAALILRLPQGDRAAFRTLYAQTAGKLAGVLTRMLRERAEVEDALQEVYVRVWQRAAQFDPARGAGMSWLVAVARNHALDRLRARPQARGLHPAERGEDGADPLDQIADTGAGAERLLIAADDARRVIDCFDTLETDRAEAVRGAYLRGLSYQDLAERHGVPLNTMRTWLRRSLIRLRECLDQ